MEGTLINDAFSMYQEIPMQQHVQAKKSTMVNQLQTQALRPEENFEATQPVQQASQTPIQVPVQQVQRPQVPRQTYAQPQPVATTTYVDVLVNRRRDVLKLTAISVVILLAISFHYVVEFFLKELIISSDFSFKQELGIRFLYPVGVFVLLWNIKALTGFK